MVSVPRKVEVTFVVPGCGSIKEIYDLGYAEHLLAWSMNERLTAAIQTHVKVIEAVKVAPSMYRQIYRSRAGMKPYIDKCLSEARQRIVRGSREQSLKGAA